MNYKVNDYNHLFGMQGFSEKLLQNHLKLYEGYVTQTNKLLGAFTQIDKETPEFAELKRRFAWEFNGMRLHEYYFDNLGGKSPFKRSLLHKSIEKHFGDFLRWQQDFEAVAGMRGIGWAVLCYDNFAQALFNTWIDQHDTGHLAGCVPILVLDAFEHAYVQDYGINRKDYIEAFMRNVRWEIVTQRFEFGVHTSAAATVA